MRSLAIAALLVHAVHALYHPAPPRATPLRPIEPRRRRAPPRHAFAASPSLISLSRGHCSSISTVAVLMNGVVGWG